MLFGFAWYRIVLYGIAGYFLVLYDIAMCRRVLYGFAMQTLHCIVMYCTRNLGSRISKSDLKNIDINIEKGIQIYRYQKRVFKKISIQWFKNIDIDKGISEDMDIDIDIGNSIYLSIFSKFWYCFYECMMKI